MWVDVFVLPYFQRAISHRHQSAIYFVLTLLLAGCTAYNISVTTCLAVASVCVHADFYMSCNTIIINVIMQQ